MNATCWLRNFQNEVNDLCGSRHLQFTVDIWNPKAPPDEKPTYEKTVADDIITAKYALQLRSGFATPVLEDVSTTIVHAGKGWLLNLRAMMKEYDVSAKIEHLWMPSLQQENDVALLEAF
eukprot:scaffold17626_cov47-Cyclotella_meneghiniana.AAC.4